MADTRSPAERLAATLGDFTFDKAVQLVRAYLVDPKFGDLPFDVQYRMHMLCDSPEEGERLDARIDELRAEHFRGLGQPVPKRVATEDLA